MRAWYCRRVDGCVGSVCHMSRWNKEGSCAFMGTIKMGGFMEEDVVGPALAQVQKPWEALVTSGLSWRAVRLRELVEMVESQMR